MSVCLSVAEYKQAFSSCLANNYNFAFLMKFEFQQPEPKTVIRSVIAMLTDPVSLPLPVFLFSRAEVVINDSSSPAVVDRSNESIKHNIKPASSKWRHNQTLSLKIRYW